MTAASITAEIQHLNDVAFLKAIGEELGSSWTYVNRIGMLIPIPIPHSEHPSCVSRTDVPDEITIHPGDPGWVDREVERQSIEFFSRQEEAARAAATKSTTTKAAVAERQAARKTRSPKRKLGKVYPTDLAEAENFVEIV